MAEPQLIDDHGCLPCPHCGRKPMVTLHPAHKHSSPLADFMPVVGDSYTVECCGGMIDDTLEGVRRKWNRREGEQVAELVEALEAARGALLALYQAVEDEFRMFPDMDGGDALAEATAKADEALLLLAKHKEQQP